MPFEIVRNDITRVRADAIVNTANPRPVYAGEVDRSIYLAAGKEKLLAARREIGEIEVGKAAYTPAFGLSARCIIHTVGPTWVDGRHGEVEQVRSCYRESLALAQQLGCTSIAFPLISTGAYHFPRDLALEAASAEIYPFVLHHTMMVYLVVYDQDSYDLSGRLSPQIRSYIDEHYVQEQQERAMEDAQRGDETVDLKLLQERRRERLRQFQGSAKKREQSLDQAISAAGPDFAAYLQELIDRRGMKNAELCRASNISRQTLSNLLGGGKPPKKGTVAALTVGLRLSLEEAEAFYARAGYSLTTYQKEDLAMRYFLERGEYNYVKINCALDACGLPTLGVKTRGL